VGSFLVLCGISYILAISGSFDFFSLKLYKFSNNEVLFIYFLIFFGFGFKVPI
jgi:formate hydrogenlyase subunit 3/multisubunit Na+/H+ antiporter MnhD subunit